MQLMQNTLKPSKPGCMWDLPQTSGSSLGTWAWDLWKVKQEGGWGANNGEVKVFKFLVVSFRTSQLCSSPAGYDSMGYEMSKPDLRAELEADLKLICEGKKDKFQVLRQQVQKYKQVFIEAVAKAKK